MKIFGSLVAAMSLMTCSISQAVVTEVDAKTAPISAWLAKAPTSLCTGCQYLAFKSPSNNNVAVGYMVYLPTEYAANPSKTYPVIYWFHGIGGNAVTTGEWLLPWFHTQINAKLIKPAIVIVPTSGGDSMWINTYDKKINAETMVINELKPLIESKFRVNKNRNSQWLEGFSMGGFGSAYYLLTYPNLFSSASTYGAALQSTTTATTTREWSTAFGKNMEFFKSKQPEFLIPKFVSTYPIKWRQVVGTKDPLLNGNRTAHNLLLKSVISSSYLELANYQHLPQPYMTAQGVNGVNFHDVLIVPTPIPTVNPTPTPTVAPTATPTIAPTPTATPTIAPTPTPVPTVDPKVVNKKACGIYVLDNGNDATRVQNIKYLTSANDGYVLRLKWSDIETSKGVYNFTVLQNVIKQVQAKGKKLSLIIMEGAYPDYFLATFTGNKILDNDGTYSIEPWNNELQTVYTNFITALSNAPVVDNGIITTLSKHSALSIINLETAGIGRLRNDQTNVTKMTTWSRTKFFEVMIKDIQLAQSLFPNTQLQYPLWPFSDSVKTPSLWSQVIDTLITNFDGIKAPKLIIVQDNLAASKDLTTGITTLYPPPTTGGQGEPIKYAFSKGLITGFQTLTSWSNPWTAEMIKKTANTTPKTAIDLAKSNFGSIYFEMYAEDYNKYLTELTAAHNELVCPQ
jgi:enterochelin esterase-like enzyme